MANVIKGYSSLHEEYDKKKRKVILWVFLAFVSILLTAEWGLFFIAVIVFGALAGKDSKQMNSKRSAIVGERTMDRVCRRLPDSYTVITNVELTAEGKTHYLDQVLVGPSGVYLIETKNMNGTVVGHADSSDLLQHKVGRNGGRYTNRVRNPIKQLSGQIYQLSNFLKYNGSNVWVKGIVYFTNREVTVNIAGSQVPIFAQGNKGAKQMRQFFNEADAKGQHLSEQDQQRVVALLTGQRP